MTALTALLVLATLFTQVSQSLPKTSYFKVVDIWLLFCIIVIFLIILFHSIIDAYVDYHPEHMAVTPASWTSAGENEKAKSRKLRNLIKNCTHGSDYTKLQLWIFVSRILTAVLFSLFNIAYWGKLCVSSGLVYQY